MGTLLLQLSRILDAGYVSAWFERAAQAGFTHLFVLQEAEADALHVQLFKGQPQEARLTVEGLQRTSGTQVWAVYDLHGDFELQHGQGAGHGPFVYGDEVSNVVGLGAAKTKRRQDHAEPGKGSALETALSLQELARWKLHWLTIEVDQVAKEWLPAAKDTALLRSRPHLEADIRAGLERLSRIVSDWLRTQEEFRILAQGHPGCDNLKNELRKLDRFVQFEARLERAQGLLQGLWDEAHAQDKEAVSRSVLHRLQRGY
jgi:hypothetical protein